MRNLHEIRDSNIPDDAKWAAIWFKKISVNRESFKLRWLSSEQELMYLFPDEAGWTSAWSTTHKTNIYTSAGKTRNYTLLDFDPLWLE